MSNKLNHINVKVGTPQELETFLFYLGVYALPSKLAYESLIVCGFNNKKKFFLKPKINFHQKPYMTSACGKLYNIVGNLVNIYEPYSDIFERIPGTTIGITRYLSDDDNTEFYSLGSTARERIDMKKWLYDTAKQRNINVSFLDEFFHILKNSEKIL